MQIRIGIWGDKPGLWNSFRIQKKLESSGIQAVVKDFRKNAITEQADFTPERGYVFSLLAEAVEKREIDYALLPAVEMAAEIVAPFQMIAVCDRTDPREVLVAAKEWVDLDNFSTSVNLAVVSAEASALGRQLLPNCKITDFINSPGSALEAMEQGRADGILMSFDAAKAWGVESLIVRKLNPNVFTPAPLRGFTVVVGRENEMENSKVGEALQDGVSLSEFHAEHSFLHSLAEAGGIIPFALATQTGPSLSLTGGMVELHGNQVIRETLSGPASGIREAQRLGARLAKLILNKVERKVLYG